MHAQASPVVFFDLGDTLATPRLDPRTGRLAALEVLPHARTVLADLHARGLPLGIISNTGQETRADMDRVLAQSGLAPFFDEALLLYSSEVGLTKDSPSIFREAVRRAGRTQDPSQCL